ncbi:MAG: DUF202 domain-containing protein, partial [SAR324 cluster bacterium]|nr:DUF202 domain-containing protein [SAR324 cluster bacterium]
PAELILGLAPEQMTRSRWFPVIKDGKTIVIATFDPTSPLVHQEVAQAFPHANIEFRVALVEDILAYIQDFLNRPPEQIVGNERTGLAYWRKSMAHWRTRLACYRTDFATTRTYLSLLRGGIGLITIGTALLRIHKTQPLMTLYWIIICIGFCTLLPGLISYFRLKRSIFRPPRHQTLVEVTAATQFFFENYQFVESRPESPATKLTMLARLAEALSHYDIVIEPSPDNHDRSYLAHDRTAKAAERVTVACYRTIYARARTGLSFIRTGVAFLSIGFGLMQYFELSLLTILDVFIIISGLFMILDGVGWYWPVRKEQFEADKSPMILQEAT